MGTPPLNSEVGQRNSRAVRSERSRQRAEAVWEDICFVAVRDRPTTNVEYASILEAERRPTPSGKGKWTDKLVQRYMRMFDSNAKKLLAKYPARTGIGVGYPAEVYSALRAEMMRLNAVNERNGIWITALDGDPSLHQAVFHKDFGHGDFVERVSLTSLRCRFVEVDHRNDTIFVERDCLLIDLKLYLPHRSAEERRLDLVDFWQRLIRNHEQGYRKLVDDWHL